MIWDFAAAAVLVYAVRTAPWRRLFDNERSHVWWGSIAAVALIWAMRPAAAMGLAALAVRFDYRPRSSRIQSKFRPCRKLQMQRQNVAHREKSFTSLRVTSTNDEASAMATFSAYY